jgi:DNA-binding GntR family transcriptional regulator
MTNAHWQHPLHNDSLAKQVFHSLKEAVFTGELQPGEPIREMHVARSMQVSQATVREALVQLQQTGLVVREPNRRTTVSAFSREEIHDRLQMRIALEELAAIEASHRLSTDDIHELERMASVIDRKIEAENFAEHVTGDIDFHHYIWARCGNAILMQTLENTTAPLFAFMSVLTKTGLVDLETMKPHQRIVDALVSRDPERIRQEIKLHMEASYEGFLKTGLPSLDALVHSAHSPANGTNGTNGTSTTANGVSHAAAS